MPANKLSKRKQPEMDDYDSCSDSENEFRKSSFSNGKSKKKKLISESESENSTSMSESSENEDVNNETSDEDKPIKKILEGSNLNKNKENVNESLDSSDDEPLSTKTDTCSRSRSSSDKKSTSKSNRCNSDDDDDKLSDVSEATTDGKLKQIKSSDESSDHEALDIKPAIKSKELKSDHVSSDEDEPLSKVKKTSNIKDKKIKSVSNNKIEHLKKYLRLSGIHIQSYDKLFADCKSIKAKTEKLLSILHEKGLKGRPTIEKCKKLRKKIETKKEISELDVSNIIQTEGRPKRGSSGIKEKAAKIESSPVEKRFSRLKDIIDSEESD